MINSSKNAKQHANYLHHSTGRGRSLPGDVAVPAGQVRLLVGGHLRPDGADARRHGLLEVVDLLVSAAGCRPGRDGQDPGGGTCRQPPSLRHHRSIAPSKCSSDDRDRQRMATRRRHPRRPTRHRSRRHLDNPHAHHGSHRRHRRARLRRRCPHRHLGHGVSTVHRHHHAPAEVPAGPGSPSATPTTSPDPDWQCARLQRWPTDPDRRR